MYYKLFLSDDIKFQKHIQIFYYTIFPFFNIGIIQKIIKRKRKNEE
jgi:hypothetical protein